VVAMTWCAISVTVRSSVATRTVHLGASAPQRLGGRPRPRCARGVVAGCCRVHAGNPVALVDAVRDVTPLITAAPTDARARLVELVAERLGLPVDLVAVTLLDATAPG